MELSGLAASCRGASATDAAWFMTTEFRKSDVPRVSIGLPVYNGARFLPEVLDTFLNQTFSDLELVICDNASTDSTQDVCRDAEQQDCRVRYIRNEVNLGANPNFNKAFHLSRAPYFKWAAHDDVYDKAYVERCVAILDTNPDVVLAHSATAFIDEKGATFPYDAVTSCYVDPYTGAHQRPDHPSIANSGSPAVRFWQVLTRARWGSHMFGLMRREALSQTQLILNFAGSDRAMLAELALLGRFQAIPEILFKKRFHEDVSWALNQAELKSFISTDGKAYSRRARQLHAFFSAASGKPIGLGTKATCTAMVGVHSATIALQALRRKEARNAAQGSVWRNKDAVPLTMPRDGGLQRHKARPSWSGS
jgi:glycosyltransferase involved in cell wall biosynthesis